MKRTIFKLFHLLLIMAVVDSAIRICDCDVSELRKKARVDSKM